MGRSGRVLAAVAVCAAVALSGCDGGGEDPTADPTTTAEPTTEEPTSEEPTSEAPEPPEVESPTPAPETQTDDHVGAIWAARYFLDLYAYMRATGDTASFEAMSAPECQFCESAVDNAREIHDAGGWVEGGGLLFDINEATVEYPTADEPNYFVRFTATEEPSVIYGREDTPEDKDGATFDVAVALRVVDGKFVVYGVNAG